MCWAQSYPAWAISSPREGDCGRTWNRGSRGDLIGLSPLEISMLLMAIDSSSNGAKVQHRARTAQAEVGLKAPLLEALPSSLLPLRATESDYVHLSPQGLGVYESKEGEPWRQISFYN